MDLVEALISNCNQHQKHYYVGVFIILGIRLGINSLTLCLLLIAPIRFFQNRHAFCFHYFCLHPVWELWGQFVQCSLMATIKCLKIKHGVIPVLSNGNRSLWRATGSILPVLRQAWRVLSCPLFMRSWIGWSQPWGEIHRRYIPLFVCRVHAADDRTFYCQLSF